MLPVGRAASIPPLTVAFGGRTPNGSDLGEPPIASAPTGDQYLKIKSQKDFASGLMFIAVGVAFAIGATNYNFGQSARPGPGYFPLLLGVILAILGGIVVLQSFGKGGADGDPIGAITWKPLVLILGAVVLFGFALPHLGMVVAVPVLIAVASLASDFRWKSVIGASVVLTAFSWLAFVYGLGLTIPVWPTFITG